MILSFSNVRYSIYKVSLEHLASVNVGELSSFFSVSRTDREISVIARSSLFREPLAEEKGWRMFYVQGSIPFSTSGVLVSLLTPLAAKKISVLAMSTFETDYVFFKEPHLESVQNSLQEAGFSISCSDNPEKLKRS